MIHIHLYIYVYIYIYIYSSMAYAWLFHIRVAIYSSLEIIHFDGHRAIDSPLTLQHIAFVCASGGASATWMANPRPVLVGTLQFFLDSMINRTYLKGQEKDIRINGHQSPISNVWFFRRPRYNATRYECIICINSPGTNNVYSQETLAIKQQCVVVSICRTIARSLNKHMVVWTYLIATQP